MLVNVNTNDAGRYSVVASNRLGLATNSALLSVVPAGPLDHWTLRTPSPQPNDLHNVIYVDGRYLSVGINGAVLTSTNGHDWAIQQSRTTNELRGITYGGGLFMAVGYQTILTSTNGVNWRNYYPGPYDLSSVAYGNGVFVAANRFGTDNFLVSSNAVDWSSINLGSYYYYLNGLTFANGRFAATASGYGMTVFTSTNGLDWATQDLGITTSRPEAVRYAGGRYVIVGSEGTVVTSNDGSQWIKRNTGASARLINVDYGNGAYVAVGVRGTILRSSDLLHWTTVNSGTPDRLEGIVFAQGKFVALGESGTTLISTDGVTWANQGQGTHLDLDGITFGENGIIMAVGKTGTILTTTNGIDFNPRNSGVTNDLHGVTFATWREPIIGAPGGFSTVRRYVAVGSESTILISDDGFNWTRRASPTNSAFKSVIYGQGLFVAVGTQGAIVTSVDGTTWRTEFCPIGFTDLNDVAFGNGTFVIATDGNSATASMVSSDGHTWSPRAVSVSRNIRGVTFAQDKFALVGNDGNIFFSENGQWIRHAAGTFRDGDNLRGVTYANGIWTVVGNNGIILTSSDTTNWVRRFSPVFINLHGVRYLNGTFVAIGNAGTVLQSDRFAPLLEGARAPGGFRLTIHPGIGNSLRLQKSSNLLNWATLTTITNPPNPSTFLDTSNTNVVEVYRVISP